MYHFMFWAQRTLATPESEPSIIEQAPNYGGPTTTVFYLAGGIILVGAIVLWGIYQFRKSGK